MKFEIKNKSSNVSRAMRHCPGFCTNVSWDGWRNLEKVALAIESARVNATTGPPPSPWFFQPSFWWTNPEPRFRGSVPPSSQPTPAPCSPLR